MTPDRLIQLDNQHAVVDGVVARFTALRAEVASEIGVLEAREQTHGLTAFEATQLADLREMLASIEEGADAAQGASPRLDALLQSAAVKSLLLRAPGLASLTRLRTRLQAERTAEVTRRTIVWPRQYRFTGPARKAKFGDQYLKPGELVELTESQAIAWADRFRAVDEIDAVDETAAARSS